MKNPKRYLVLVMTMAALAAANVSNARQLGNGGTTYSGLMTQTRPEEFLGRFVELAQAEMAANTVLLNALGVADAAKPAAGAVQALDTKASTGDISKVTAAAGATHQLLTQTLGTRIQLSEANKTSFANGALALTHAARDFTELTKNIGITKQALTTAGAPARVALYAARCTPDEAAQLRAELKAVVAFANANQVSLAAEVTEAAAAM